MVFKSKGLTKAKCPILSQLGIGEDNAARGKDQDWVKTICRDCPYDKCVYDQCYTGGEARHKRVVERNREIFKLSNEGKTVKELEKIFNLSTRTIKSAIKGDDEH